MYLKSLFPPVPPLPATNFHNVIFRGPGSDEVPEHVMHIDAVSGQKRTRSEFIERMYDCATALGASREAGGLGLTSDHMVGILSDNCLDYVVLVHSLLAITTPFVLFSSYATPREMTHSLTKSKATHIFVQSSLLQSIVAVAREQGLPEDHIYILDGQRNINPSPPGLGQLIEKVRKLNIPREPVREAGKNTLAYLVFSSGTSGLPKAVMISHGNLVFSLVQGAMVGEEMMKVMNPPPDLNDVPVALCFLPFFHSYGLHFTILKAPLRAATQVIMPRWNLDMALNLISKYRVTTIPTIPSVIHQLANSQKFAKADLSSIQSVGSGAAYLPPSLSDKFKGMFPGSIMMQSGYGLSEATISAIGRPLPGMFEGRVESIDGSTGVLFPGQVAMILRPDGTHCLSGERGELYIKGDNVALGYWNNPEATKETFIASGWLRTGDNFRANNKGTFWFEDRAKDTLKVSGLQVSPAEIEEVLRAEPSGLVNDVAVAGVQTPGSRTSDDRSPRAWVVLSTQGRQLPEERARAALEAWSQANLSKYKWLRGGIQFVQEIPKNPTGKVLRRVLQDQYVSEASSRAKL